MGTPTSPPDLYKHHRSAHNQAFGKGTIGWSMKRGYEYTRHWIPEIVEIDLAVGETVERYEQREEANN